MSFKNPMDDPILAKTVFMIERAIHEHDRKAADDEITVKDSDVKSAIRKALSQLKGKPAATKPKNELDRWKAELAEEFVALAKESAEFTGASRAEYGQSLLLTESSLKTRREMGGHSRGYLEFLAEFLADSGFLDDK